MKKVLIGCGVLALLFVMAIVGIVIFVGVKANRFTNEMDAASTRLQALSADYPFTVPDEGTAMDPVRFEDYLAVREGVREEAMAVPLFAEIAAATEENREPRLGPTDIFGVIGAMPDLLNGVAARMESQEMAPGEYGWYSMETLQAIYQLGQQGDETFGAAWRELEKAATEIETVMDQQGGGQAGAADLDMQAQLQQIAEATVPQENLDLVKQHEERLTTNPLWLALEAAIAGEMTRTQPFVSP